MLDLTLDVEILADAILLLVNVRICATYGMHACECVEVQAGGTHLHHETSTPERVAVTVSSQSLHVMEHSFLDVIRMLYMSHVALGYSGSIATRDCAEG